MTRISLFHSKSPLRTSLMVMAIWMPLLALVMPVWIQAHMTQFSAVRPPLAFAKQTNGQYKVTNFEWHDETRGRSVPVRLFWPAAAQSGEVPLVVFSPGIGSSRDGYTYLGRYWAEHGIASLHLQHVGSDRSLWQGNVFSLVSRFQRATSEAEAIARVQDARFALDHLLQSRFGAKIAHDQIAAAGHSYGANTTLLEAGATVTRDGRVLNFRDPRISAAIIISAPPFYSDGDMRPILASVTIPTLHITTENDVIRIPGFGSGVLDRQRVFDATGSAYKVLAIYSEGSHNVFTDRRYFDTRQVADEVKWNTKELSLAFLQQLHGQPAALTSWPSEYPGLIAKYVVQR